MRIDPQQLLTEMQAQATPRKSATLQLLAEICVEQIERGSNDFSIATIGKLSADRGGPSAAAIRNKPGEDYRGLIKAYADAAGGHSKKKRASPPTDAEAFLEGVADPVLKTRVALLLAELTSTRSQLQAARFLLNQSAVVQLGQASESPAVDAIGLTYQEVSALGAALAPLSLSHWGWIVDDSGRVTTDTGQVVFRAGFATAVKKVVEHFSN